jgi:ParB-like chromosome segregation protein Spo0J
MSERPQRQLIEIDPALARLSNAAPLRFRYHLPGEARERETDRRLTESVKRHGIIQPPLLMGTPGGNTEALTVLLGHRRLAAARAAGLGTVGALLLPEGTLSKREIIALWLEDTGAGEPPSELERIRILARAVSFTGEPAETMLPDLSAAFGRDLSTEIYERLVSFLSMPADIQEALHEGALSPGDLLELSGCGAVDTEAAARWLRTERLNRRQQQEAVRLLLMLAGQGQEQWERFAGGTGEGLPLLDRLRRACYPTMTRDLSEIEDIVRSMKLPQAAALQPPEHMEGAAYSLHVRVRSEEMLAEALKKMQRALETGKIHRLLAILRGKTVDDTRP